MEARGRDSKRGRLRKDPRAALLFSNLGKISKSYSKLLENDFSFFLKNKDSKSFFQTIGDALRKFAAVVEKHRVRLGRKRIICQWNSCKNTPLTPSSTTIDGSVLYGYCY